MIDPNLLPGPSGPEGGVFNAGSPMSALADLEDKDKVEPTDDLYPVNEEAAQKLLAWCNQAFQDAEAARKPHEEKWRRFHKLYRAYIPKDPNDWRSRVFIPIPFWVIETVAPRLVAQLPKFTCDPVGEEDVAPAKRMEVLLDYSVRQSKLHVELVTGIKSALKYGTGIFKTYHRVDMIQVEDIQPVMAPLIDKREVPLIDPDTQQQMLDADQNPVFTMQEDVVGETQVGTKRIPKPRVVYDGPGAECVDIFNFWPAPEAKDIDSARYVIHRVFKPLAEIKRRVAEGIYRWPDNMGQGDTDTSEDPAFLRMDDVGLGSGDSSTRKDVELLEFWLDDGRVITVANRKAILRVVRNPFYHQEKPFVRVVDYLQEHEFWGMGEIEPIQGLTDLQNALSNSLVDHIRLVLNAMFFVNVNGIVDMRDLRIRPNGMIKLKGDFKPEEIIKKVDFGDAPGSSFAEINNIQGMIEKISGMDLATQTHEANTATGQAIAQEQGASRFGLKVKLAEQMGLTNLARQYGSILQQFMTDETVIRLTGPSGEPTFDRFDPMQIQGALDYGIQAESTTQTQTMREQMAQTLLQMMAAYSPGGVPAAVENLLDQMGIKDKTRYLQGIEMVYGQYMGTAQQPSTEFQSEAQAQEPGMQQMAAAGGAIGTPGQGLAENQIAQTAALYNSAAEMGG